MIPVTHVRPRAHEVAVIHRPDGAPVHVHTAAGTRVLKPMAEGEPVIAAVPGNADLLEFGAPLLRYSRLRAVRNGRHADDREAWDDAVAVLGEGGAVYIPFERTDRHGRARWQAGDIRYHIDTPSYRVVFDRIGRNHEPPDLVTDRVGPGSDDDLWAALGPQIDRHARMNGVRSRDTDVVFDPDTMRGKIIVGGFRNAGDFRVTEHGVDPAFIRQALAAIA